MMNRKAPSSSHDDKYLAILLKRIRVCKNYKPKFGQGANAGLSLKEFQKLYRSDPFYSWFGLDNPLMYAAHKAAGGITSVYRQIGIGCEEAFRQMLQDQLGLAPAQSKWSYEITTRDGHARKLSLDGRIQISEVKAPDKQKRISAWLKQATEHLHIAPEIAQVLKGVVFEVRQGYKSKDSKRQNADIANAATAYSQGYLPVVVVLSAQIDNEIADRYASEKWLVLRGYTGRSAIESTYIFSKQVLGYDLARFFERNRATLKSEVVSVLKSLLETNA